MSDWFKNSASEIPDDLWRAPTPMQRQADAVVMWAELTGKHASAPKPLWEQQGVKSWAQEDALMAAIKAEATPARKAKLTQRLHKLQSSNLEGDYGIKSKHASAPKPTLRDRLRGAKLSLTSTPIRKAPPEAMYMAAVGRKRNPTAKYLTYDGTNYKIASLAEMVGIAQAREGLKEMRSRGPREPGLLGYVSADEIRNRMADQESMDKVMNPRLHALAGGIGGGLYGAHKMRSPLGALAMAGAGAGIGALSNVAGRGLGNAITRPYLEKALRDKEAAWKPGVQKAIRMAGDNLEITGAALGAPLGGLKAYTDYREGKGGISKAEATLKGEITKAQSQKVDKKKVAKLRQKLQTAKSRRENIGVTTAKGVGLGAATGALGAHALKRMRRAGRK